MFLCGIVLQLSTAVPVKMGIVIFAAGCQLYLVYMICRDKKKIYRFTAVFGMAFLLLGIIRTTYVQQKSSEIELLLQEVQDGNKETLLKGKIEKKERKNNQLRLYLNHAFLQIGTETYRTNSVLVRLKEEPSDQSYRIGTTIVLKGNVQEFQHAANDGNYDEYQYYHSLNMDYYFEAEQLCLVSGRENVLEESLFQLKEKLKQNYTNNLSERNAGILSTMLLGDKELLNREVSSVFQQAGAGHILVISGMHISCIGMFLYSILRKKGSRYLAGTIAVLVLYYYAKMTGMGTSAVRAWLMFALLMAAKMLGRSYDSRTGLAAAVLLLLWKNPYLIENSGFQFSVAAILGVVVTAKNLTQAFEKDRPGREKVRNAIFVSLSIQLTTFPLAACYYYEVPAYAVLLNILIVPLLSVVLINGIIATLLMCMGKIIAGPVVGILELLLNGIFAVTGCFSRLPGATQIVGRWSLQRILLYYLLLALFCVLFQRSNKILSGRKKWMVPAAGITGLLLFLRPVNCEYAMAVLDVGQGDGIYLSLGKDKNIFLDGGSTDVSKVGQYRILPFLKSNGIRKIDYWMVSHYDEDHVSGLLEILEMDYPIEHIVLPERRDMQDAETCRQICMLAEQRKIPLVYMKAGDVLENGEDVIRCILPDSGYQADDENGNSLIFVYETKAFSCLFTGDAGEAEEEYLVKQKLLKKVWFLKVGHHGSKYSSSEDFLKEISPMAAFISCGKENRYGHPHKETIDRLNALPAKIYSTTDCGQISVGADKKGVWMKSYRDNFSR